MNQADWEGLISCYLKDKGYKEAEQALERVRARDTDASMALSDRLSVHKGVVEQLIETFATSEQPQGYVDALERFSSWIDNSLDVHRGELSKLLHPVFLHTYLALIKRDAQAVATPLLAWYQRRLVAVEGPLSRVRATELEELKGVAVKQELTRNTFVRQVLSGKQTVRLSPYAKELLVHYLHSQKNMLCLASIINQYIKIEEVTDQPKVAQEEEEEEEVEADDDDGSADRADAEAANVNTATVNLGLLKGNVEDRHVDALELKAQEENKPAAGQADAAAAAGEGSKAGDKDKAKEPAGAAGAGAAEGAAPAPKKAKKDAKAGADVAAAAPVGTVVRLHPGERVDPQPWTPVLSEGVANAWLKDIQLRAEVGPSALPSCCFFTFANTRQTLNCAAFTLAADKVAAGFADSSVRLYDLTARRPGSRFAGEAGASSKGGGASKGPGAATVLDADEEEPPGVSYLYGHTGPVHATCFSHDSRVLFSGSADGTVRAWSADQGHALTSYKGHLLPVWDVAAGPLGYHFVSGGADRTARVWATDSARMIRIMAGHQADVDVVGWHPNCMYVATASTDRSVRLWDVATGQCVRFLTGLASAPTCMAMHPDGRHIAVGSDRGSILVWDMGSARRLASFKAHMGPVWSLAYSKGQGSLLASGGADETVRLWSTQAAMPSGDATAGSASSKAEPSKGPDSAATKKPYSQLLTCHTKSSSVTQLQFSNRNLLLAAGAFNLKQRRT